MKNFLGLINEDLFRSLFQNKVSYSRKVLKKLLDEMSHLIKNRHQELNEYCIDMLIRRITPSISADECQ
jgi:hypothetical protein